MIARDEKSACFDEVGIPVHSPDGAKVAFRARIGRHWFVLCGDQLSEPFDIVGEPRFRPDGGLVAFTAARDNREFVVVGAERWPAFDHVAGTAFSPDGSKLAFAAVRGGRRTNQGIAGGMWFVVVNREAGREFAYIEPPSLVFSPDGKTLAYVASKKSLEKQCVVVGDDVGEEFSTITNLTFDPRDQTPVYCAYSYASSKSCVVIGDISDETFDFVGTPAFDRCSGAVAYAALNGGRWFVVAAGKKTELDVDLVATPLTFSSDGRKIAFGARKGLELWWKVVRVE